MDSFGLGIVLNFTDNATAGIQGVSGALSDLTDSINNVSAVTGALAQREIGQFAVQLGNDLYGTGTAITGMFTDLMSNVSTMGSTLENARITLTKFFGSAEEGEKVLDWIMDFGAKSPFESMDVIPIALSFKAAGVDIRKEIQMMNGDTQSLMASLGDLMALHPEIPMSRWKLAFQNALSGAPKVLQNILDVGLLEDVIGHKFGAGEDAVNSIVELTQKLNVEGMMTEMFGTWGQTVSNMTDIWDKFLKEIADAGAFDSLKRILNNIAGTLSAITDEQMKAFGKTMSEALTVIINPLIKLSEYASKAIGWLIKISEERPGLAKLVIQITAITGIALIVAGVLLKFGGALLMLNATLILSQSSGLVFGKVLGIIGKSLLSLVASILPVIALIGLVYLAWTRDLGGLKTSITNFVRNFQNSWKLARDIVDMSCTDMMAYINNIDRENFFQNMIYNLVKLWTAIDLVKDAWGDFTLSEENFKKAEALGLLPFIEALLYFKTNMLAFIDGFKLGLSDFILSVKEALSNLGNIGIDIDPIIAGVTVLLDLFSKLDTEQWEKIGRIVGQVLPIIILMVGVFKTMFVVVSIITTIASAISKFASVIGFLFKAVGGIVKLLLGFGKLLISVVTTIAGVIGWPITIAILVIGALAIMYHKFEWFRDLVQAVFWSIVATVGAVVGGIVIAVVGVVTFIVQLFSYLVTAVITIFMGIVAAIKIQFEIIRAVITTVILGIYTVIKTYVEAVIATIQTYITVFLGIIKTAMEVFQGIIETVVAIVKAIFTGNFSELGETINNIWSSVGENISNIWNTVIETVLGLWSSVKESFMSGIESIKNTWSICFDNIKNIASSTLNSIVGVWTKLTGVFDNIWEGIKNTAGKFFNWIGEKFSLVTNLVDKVKNFFGDKKELTVNVVGNESDKDMLGLSTGGYVKSTGIAVLHPNEVVLNSKLTKGLENLVAHDNALGLSTLSQSAGSVPLFQPVGLTPMGILHADSGIDEQNEIVINNKVMGTPVSDDQKVIHLNTPYRPDFPVRTPVPTSPTPTGGSSQIVFEEGSIVLKIEKASEAEARRFADQIYKEIKRKKEIEDMMNYKELNKGG